MWFTGGWDSDASLIAHGAIVPEYVRYRGEWWRIVSGAFLHDGFLHIGVNMFSLWQLGTVVEVLIGSSRMLQVYALSMVGSGLAIVYLGPDVPTIGASGAIFGLFGALMSIGLRLGRRGRAMVLSMVPILVLNLIITFAVPNIAISAHLGGLATGFLIGFGMRLTPRGRALLVGPPPAPTIVRQEEPALSESEEPAT
ncbi:MAG TPA: rhomboid family intramembrane serine protease [Candidatus Acidoferrales bacterium]|nr:rhomboid family intramembrane serine protease [Candidatus Acidoferrales bacterium]